jgi:hypothetical protein
MRMNCIRGLLLAGALGAVAAGPAPAQRTPTVAIMPTQYFSASPAGAAQVTHGLAEEFDRRGYRVMSLGRSRDVFNRMRLSPRRHYPDRVAVRFGRRMGADLVVYPRLLAVGRQLVAARGAGDEIADPAAVLHLRVLNANTGGALYFRQIAYEFPSDLGPRARLPEAVASDAAAEITRPYFQRVAGSREEMRGAR